MYNPDIKDMNARATILALLLVISAASAAVNIQPIDLTFAVPAVAIVVVVFLAISNMMATTTSNPRLQAWAKTELREFFAALVLIVAITAAFVGSTGVSEALTGEQDYVEVAQQVIDSWIDNYDMAFQYIVRAGTRIRTAATYSPYINIPLYWVSISYSSNPIGGASILLISLNIAAQGLANVTFIYEGLRLVVLFMKVTVPQIFLPLAFVVRLIPFTRKAGNTLIALAIAGIVFLPFSIIFADALHDVMDSPSNPNDGVPTPRIGNLDDLNADPWAMAFAEPFCESAVIRTMLSLTDPLFAIIVCLPTLLIPVVGTAIFNACKPLVEYVIYPIIQVVFQVLMAVILIAWTAYFAAAGGEDYAEEAFDALYPFLRDVNNVVLMGYLDFVIIALITIAGARGLSTALGGEWYMAGIQRLI